MTARVLVALVALAAACPSSHAASPRARVVPDDTQVAALVVAATDRARPDERGAARDAIFHDVYPAILEEGVAPTADERVQIASAVRSLACTSSAPRVKSALVRGDLASVTVGGATGGGCTYLLRRDGAAWVELMPISWTLHP